MRPAAPIAAPADDSEHPLMALVRALARADAEAEYIKAKPVSRAAPGNAEAGHEARRNLHPIQQRPAARTV